MKRNHIIEYDNSRSERRIQNNRIRRVRERRKNICLFLIAVALIISCFFTVGSFLAKAQSSHRTITHKTYKSISVCAGDNLTRIAKENLINDYDDPSVYVEEVKQINHLEDDIISSGMYIVVPHYEIEVLG